MELQQRPLRITGHPWSPKFAEGSRSCDSMVSGSMMVVLINIHPCEAPSARVLSLPTFPDVLFVSFSLERKSISLRVSQITVWACTKKTVGMSLPVFSVWCLFKDIKIDLCVRNVGKKQRDLQSRANFLNHSFNFLKCQWIYLSGTNTEIAELLTAWWRQRLKKKEAGAKDAVKEVFLVSTNQWFWFLVSASLQNWEEC